MILLIALIMLVAMTLAGIGMMRSVDTGSVIAGNLAFKQAALSATDAGTNAAYGVLMSMANSTNGNNRAVLSFNAGQPCTNNNFVQHLSLATAGGCTNGAGTTNLSGYASVPIDPCEVLAQTSGALYANGPTCNSNWQTIPWWTVAANWNGAPSIQVTDPNTTQPIAQVQYLIHRMCVVGNQMPIKIPTVVLAAVAGNAGNVNKTQVCQSVSVLIPSHSGKQPLDATLYFYRITTRSVGTRGSVSYAQSLVLVGA